MSGDLITHEDVRRAVRRFLAASFDQHMSVREWLGRLLDAGWACATWPVGLGGLDMSPELAAAAYDEFQRAAVPGPPSGLARLLAGPTLLAHGSDEQQREHLASILLGDETWCQLFSEPEAGSDLAGLQTTARREGDCYVVTGQKVWTSGALEADMGMLLARTDLDVPKHRGLTYLVLDMSSPGVEVRPLKQMTGDELFAEVFLTDVKVPVSNVVGEVGHGWAVAMTTLASERLALGAQSSLRFPVSPPAGRRLSRERDITVGELMSRPVPEEPESASGGAMVGRGIDALLGLAVKAGRDSDPHVRQALARLYTLDRVNAWNTLRATSAARAGKSPGPEASLGKLMASRIARAWREAATAIAGADAMLTGADGPLDGLLARQFLFAPAPSLYGGTDQIQRNIVGERVLGLAKEPDPSREVPFRLLRDVSRDAAARSQPSRARAPGETA